MSEYLRS